MRSLLAFENVTLDGFFTGPGGELDWAHDSAIHPPDPEFDAFVAGNAEGGGELLFGRITYQMMAGYWPSPMARDNDPVVAERMNALPKVVFSRTLEKATWNATRLVQSDPVAEVRRMKQEPGDGMVVLGSGTIVAQLVAAGLVDELQLVLNPVVLGAGRTLFAGLSGARPWQLTQSRAFPGGKVVLSYTPR
jgi:dihydrofolate reductase